MLSQSKHNTAFCKSFTRLQKNAAGHGTSGVSGYRGMWFLCLGSIVEITVRAFVGAEACRPVGDLFPGPLGRILNAPDLGAHVV